MFSIFYIVKPSSVTFQRNIGKGGHKRQVVTKYKFIYMKCIVKRNKN